MLPYIVMDLILIVLAMLLSPHKERELSANYRAIRYTGTSLKIKKEYLYTILVVCIITLFMGLRGNFTTDYDHYLNIFLRNSNRSFGDIIRHGGETEKGFLLLGKAISVLSTNQGFYMTVIALIFVLCIISEGRQQVTNIFIFVFMFVNAGLYLTAFNLMRQALVVAIIYAGSRFLRKKQPWKYALVVIACSFLHTSSLIMLAAIPFLMRKVKLSNIMQMVVAGICGYIWLDDILMIIQQFHYGGYIYGMGNMTSVRSVLVQWCIALFVFSITKLYHMDTDSMTSRLIINGTILYVIFSVMGLSVWNISRISLYFFPYLIAGGANCLDRVIQDREMRLWEWLAIILLIIYPLISVVRTSVYSYYFFWQK